MQIPAQGKFSENPGWALRPPSGQNSERTKTALRVRRHMQGFGGMLPNISVNYTGNPQTDFNLQVQALGDWYSKYYQQAYSIAEQVIAELRRRGFTVDVKRRPEDICNPNAGCVDFTGHEVVLSRNGKQQYAGVGDRGLYSRLNSVSEVADMIERNFEMYAQPTTTASAAAPSSTTAVSPASASAATAYYSKSAVLYAPDGYRVGGRFTVKIHGKPNSQVTIRAWQNSHDHGTTPFGSTDSSGYFEISGVWGDEHVGTWREIVYVGGEQVGELNFTLDKPQRQPLNTVSTQTAPATQTPTATQLEIPSSATQPDIVAEANKASDGKQEQSSILPLLIIGGIAAFLLFSDEGKKK